MHTTQTRASGRCSFRIISSSLALLLLCFSLDTTAGGWFDRLKEKVTGQEAKEQSLAPAEIGDGLKEALKIGTQTVVDKIGVFDGFNLDPRIHIPLPGKIEKTREVLGKLGMDSMLADLELRLNRAAETAVPKAKPLFLNAIDDMTLDDVMAIYNGPQDAATRYFREKMSAQLASEMRPVVEQSLTDAGAVKAYDRVVARYNAVPYVPKVEANLSDYVVEKGMDGVFLYLAREEAAIRRDPAKRTTDLLRRVFGQ